MTYKIVPQNQINAFVQSVVIVFANLITVSLFLPSSDVVTDKEGGVEEKAFALARSLQPKFRVFLKEVVRAMGPLGEGVRGSIDTFMEFFAPNIVKFLKAVLSVSSKFIPALTPLLVDIEAVLFHPKMSLLHSFNGAFRQLVLNLQEPTKQYVRQLVPVCANFTQQVSQW